MNPPIFSLLAGCEQVTELIQNGIQINITPITADNTNITADSVIFTADVVSQKITIVDPNSDGVIRAYQFGIAPEEPTLPYVTWQGIGGSPFNNLDARPSGDMVLTQIDIYDIDSDRIYELANAVRYAIELECNVTAFRDLSKDATTGVYHIGLDVMFVLPA